ncbi:hypothetical protein [Chamaesiphon sp. VAR_69_metabat_338]|nr:hypothetical protein [Chamaesiphon sp. VAR_69_metabat_338]
MLTAGLRQRLQRAFGSRQRGAGKKVGKRLEIRPDLAIEQMDIGVVDAP